MMAEEKNVEDLRNLTQCSICRERYSDPRVLPCLHTFCLDCLQKAGSSRRPGDRMPCPLCRKEFVIPEEDFEGLQKDFRLQSLIEMSRLPVAIHRSAAAAAAGTAEEAELEAVQKVFCFDCRVAVDVRCYFEGHRKHSCCDIFKAIEELRRKVLSDEEKALVWETDVLHRSHELDKHKDVLLRQLNLVDRRVSKRGDDVRRLVEAHIKALAGELEVLRQRSLEEMGQEMDALNKLQLTLRRYRSRCDRLKSMEETVVPPGDICRLATELQAEAERLRSKHEAICRDRKSRSPEIEFKETLLEEFLTKSNNSIVGTLEAHRESRGRIHAAVQASAAILRLLGLLDLRILGSGLFGLLAGLLVAAGLSIVAGAVGGLLMGGLMLWMLSTLLPRTECLQLSVSLRTDGSHASGVTFLRHRLYVILQSPPLIVVYQSDAPYNRLKEIQLNRVALPWDIGSCHQTNSLYVTDSGNRCVWKVSPDDDDRVSIWLTDMDRPHTLSVSSDGRALFVRDGHPRSTLEVYGPDGVMVERIRVPVKIRQPHHAVETCAGTFIVSHGTWIGQTHGLVELTRDGEIVRSYSSTESLWGILKSITLLLDPSIRRDDVRHLALDADDRLFVADWFNDRIIRFDSRFRLGQMFRTSSRTAAGWPILRFCYVKETRQMLIVHETARENRVHVYRITT